MVAQARQHHDIDAKLIEQAQRHQTDLNGKQAPEAPKAPLNFSDPLLAITSPAGIAMATPASVQYTIGKSLHTSVLQDATTIVQGSHHVLAKQGLSLFAHSGGAKLIAAQDPVNI